jgi:hypothetical protein
VSTAVPCTAVREAELDWVDIGVRPGYKQKYQGFFDAQKDLAVRVGSLYAEPYYHSPRHRHTFPQLRFVVSGEMRYGKEIYGPGDCLLIPEGGYYGPILPLEGAGEDAPQLHFVDMQYQGPSGLVYPDPELVVRTRERLSEEGSFAEGVYTDAQGRKHDGYEAILARIMGVDRIEYPEPRTTGYLVCRSYIYPWTELTGTPRAHIRHLAYLNECGPNVKLVRLQEGAQLAAGVSPGHQVRWVIDGAIEYEGEEYEAISFAMFPNGDEHGEMRARRESTLLVAQWLQRPPASTGEAIPFCRL